MEVIEKVLKLGGVEVMIIQLSRIKTFYSKGVG
jgi:hypothetical protein